MNIDFKTPRWFVPFLQKARYKAAYGGRSSGKSHQFAELALEAALLDKDFSLVCIREIQKSLKQSVKRLLELKIQHYNIGSYFEIQDQQIRRVGGSGIIIFMGMQNHTADSIKSLESYDAAWVEEAHTLSQYSLEILRPTLRKSGSELWFSWNPRSPEDPVDAFFRKEKPPEGSIVCNVTYRDNPLLPQEAVDELEYDKKRDFEKYLHVWEGGYELRSESLIFRNWRVAEFEPSKEGERLYFGADWGFNDPTVLVSLFIRGKTLYVEHEAYAEQVDVDELPLLFQGIPKSDKYPIVGDSSRPETISYMQKKGYKVFPSVKGKGSVLEGIAFLRSYDIVIHPRCPKTAEEFRLYSFETDKLTGAVLPEPMDKYNHCIDAMRYAIEGERRANNRVARAPFVPQPRQSLWSN